MSETATPTDVGALLKSMTPDGRAKFVGGLSSDQLDRLHKVVVGGISAPVAADTRTQAQKDADFNQTWKSPAWADRSGPPMTAAERELPTSATDTLPNKLQSIVAPITPDSTGGVPYWKNARARVQAADAAAPGGDAGIGPATAEGLRGALGVAMIPLAATPVGGAITAASVADVPGVNPVLSAPGAAGAWTAKQLGAGEVGQDIGRSLGNATALVGGGKALELLPEGAARIPIIGSRIAPETFVRNAIDRAPMPAIPEIPTGRSPLVPPPAPLAEGGATIGALDAPALAQMGARPVVPDFSPFGATTSAALAPEAAPPMTTGAMRTPGTPIDIAAQRAAFMEHQPSPGRFPQELMPRTETIPVQPEAQIDPTSALSASLRPVQPDVTPPETVGLGDARVQAAPPHPPASLGAVGSPPSPPDAGPAAAPGEPAPPPRSGSPLQWIKQVTRTAPDQFKTLFGAPGARIGRMAEEFAIENRRGQSDVRTIQLGTEDLTPEDRAQMTQVAEGRLPPQNAAQAKALAMWRQLHPEIARGNNASGARITENVRPDQLPQEIPTTWRLTQGDDGTVNVTRPINEDSQTFSPMRASPEARRLIAERDPATIAKIAEKNVGYGKQFETKAELDDALKSFEDDRSLKSKNPGTESPRKIILPDELREPDWVKSITDYAKNARRSRAEHLAVKYRVADGPDAGAPRNPDSKGVPQGDLGDALAQIRETQGVDAANEAEMRFKNLVGRADVGPGDANVKAASSVVSSLNALLSYSMKPITVLRHATQTPFLAAWLSDVDPTILARAAKDVATSPRDVYDTAVRSGAMDTILRTPETLGETTPEGEPVSAAAKAAHGLRVAANVGMSPLSAFSGVQRMTAVAAADYVAPRLAAQIRGGGYWAKNALAKLDTMHFAPERVARLVAGTMTDSDMDALRQGIVRVTQGTAWADEKPAWMNTPAGSMATMGKQFEVAQTRNSARVALDPLKRGNVIPGATLAAGAVGAGAAILGAKRLLQGPTKSSEDPSTAGALLEDASEGGLGGAVTKLASAVDQAWRGNQGNSAVDSQVMPSLLARAVDVLNFSADFGRNAEKEPGDKAKKSSLEMAGRAALDQIPAVREWVNTVAAFSPEQLKAKIQTMPKTPKNLPLIEALMRRVQMIEGAGK